MTVVGQKQKYWGEYNPKIDDFTYCNRLGSLENHKLIPTALSILTCASSGAATGAILGGAPTGGLGAVPGGIIGGVAGALACADVLLLYDFYEYVEYKKKVTQEVRDTLEDILKSRVDGMSECSIKYSLATVPCRIKGEKQIYEKQAIEEWLAEHGTSPFTRRSCTTNDIEIDYESVAKIGRACNDVLNNQEERNGFKKEVIDGLIILRKQSLEQVETYYNKKVDELMAARKSRKISPREFHEAVGKLAEIADPILHEEGKSDDEA